MPAPLTIWSNAKIPGDALDLLQLNIKPHRLISSALTTHNLQAGPADPLLAEADIVFGQPDPQQIIDSPNIKWIQLTSAGYTRYDTPAFRAAMQSRQGILTNSSAVFADPCAQHVLAMMLGLARELPTALHHQRTDQLWPTTPIRENAFLLTGQTAIIYGYGSIARRLIELLAPFRMDITAVRRHIRGDETVPTITPAQADALLGEADHVINILPASHETERFFTADRFTKLKPSAIFYNIGRGSTVDQVALRAVLETRRIAAAYLDVTTPEPLPPASILWRLSNCYITPHTAGGHSTEFERLVHHFLNNLQRYTGNQPLLDRVV